MQTPDNRAYFPVAPPAAAAVGSEGSLPRTESPNPAPAALFLAGTPLHTFWSLGLMHGPFSAYRNVLAVIDQKDTDRDFIAEVLADRSEPPVTSVLRFPALGKLDHAQPVLASLARLVAQLQPAYVAVGNDRRVEFHLAAHAAPAATRGYVDDGLFSYIPRKEHRGGRFGLLQARFSDWRRSRQRGFPVEQPTLVGGSRAVQEAWVMLPEQVHAGLAGKSIHALRPQWFATPQVREICAAAARRSDFDAAQCADLRLLLLLPHGSFLREHPEIARRMEQFAQSYAARGQLVAFKCHPRTSGVPIRVPDSHCIEIPRRLPIEILAPQLADTQVVGTLTTALISLLLLGQRLDVRSVSPHGEEGSADDIRFNRQALKIYQSVGIRPFV